MSPKKSSSVLPVAAPAGDRGEWPAMLAASTAARPPPTAPQSTRVGAGSASVLSGGAGALAAAGRGCGFAGARGAAGLAPAVEGAGALAGGLVGADWAGLVGAAAGRAGAGGAGLAGVDAGRVGVGGAGLAGVDAGLGGWAAACRAMGGELGAAPAGAAIPRSLQCGHSTARPMRRRST